MTKLVPVDQINMFETEQQFLKRREDAAKLLEVAAPIEPKRYFPGISNDYYDSLVIKANKIKELILSTRRLYWDTEDSSLRIDLDELWYSYSFHINVIKVHNPEGISELCQKGKQLLEFLVAQLNALEEDGDNEEFLKVLFRYELLDDQVRMLS